MHCTKHCNDVCVQVQSEIAMQGFNKNAQLEVLKPNVAALLQHWSGAFFKNHCRLFCYPIFIPFDITSRIQFDEAN